MDILKFDLLSSLGLLTASQKEREEALRQMTRIILAEVSRRIKKSIPLDKREEYENIFADTASPQEMRMRFLRENVADFQDIVLEETVRFKLEAMEAVQTAPTKNDQQEG